MPVYYNSGFDERIYKGKEQIKRVYKGKELNYGIYDITYNPANGLPENPSYNPKLTVYAWGKDRKIDGDLTYNQLEAPENYKYKFYGWLKDKDLISKVDKSYKSDLKLKASFKQKKFTYSGTYKISKKVYDGEVRDHAPTPAEYSKYWEGTNSSLCLPNCVIYAYWRPQEAGAPAPINGKWNPSDWPSSVINGWYFISRCPISEIKPGDVIITTGHVAFVEKDGTVTESYYTGGSHPWSGSDISVAIDTEARGVSGATPLTVYQWCLDNYARFSAAGGYGLEQNLEYRMWHNTRSIKDVTGNESSSYLGVVRYDNWPEPQSKEVEETIEVSETDCLDQEYPEVIDPEITEESTTPQGWESVNKFTYIRTCEYDEDTAYWPDDWQLESDSDWSTYWSP